MSNKENNKPERLQKFLANYGVASRRKIEELIQEGVITVNGKVAELGCRVDKTSKIVIDGKKFVVPDTNLNSLSEIQLIAYHKPIATVCTSDDPEGRATVFDDLPKLKNSKWISIGRLDLNTSGLLLFTNNGGLANKLMHPSNNFEREYLVRVLGEVNDQKIKKLLSGVKLEDGMARFKSITRLKNNSYSNQDSGPANTWYKVVLMEGRKREVRRLWEAVDCKVSRLTRVRFGPFILPKDLKPGKCTPVKTKLIKDILNK